METGPVGWRGSALCINKGEVDRRTSTPSSYICFGQVKNGGALSPLHHMSSRHVASNQLSTGSTLPLPYICSKDWLYKENWYGRVTVLLGTESEGQEKYSSPRQCPLPTKLIRQIKMCFTAGSTCAEKARNFSFLVVDM
jgi:hypothetical protein